MNPVVILCHAVCEPPGYFCEYLDASHVPYQTVYVKDHAQLADQLDHMSGLVVLGAAVSVYDPLPWIAGEAALVKQALQRHLPILGICFGAQLLARALGGEVRAADGMQIGWHPVQATPQGRRLLDGACLPETFSAFEWHGDTFSLPQGAVALFHGDCIRQQGFIHENCLAVQFHLEITTNMIQEWIQRYQHCLQTSHRCVQTADEMLNNLQLRLMTQRRVADQLFGWWLERVTMYEESRGAARHREGGAQCDRT